MARLWVPLDVDFQDDDRMVGVSAEAELLFLRSLALAKRLASDGRIRVAHLRRLSDKLSGSAEKYAEELIDAGLWECEGTPGASDERFVIASWLRWNAAADEIDDVRERKSAGGKLGNHRRYNHSGDVDVCGRCNRSESDHDRGSHTDRTPSVGPSLSLSPDTETDTETETETEKYTSDVPSDDDEPAAPEERYDFAAVDLTRHLGTRIKANGHKVPAKGSTTADSWFQAIDRLLRLDEADEREVRQVIDWCTADEFWRSTIRSAPKFREQYTTLRLQRQRGSPGRRAPAGETVERIDAGDGTGRTVIRGHG